MGRAMTEDQLEQETRAWLQDVGDTHRYRGEPKSSCSSAVDHGRRRP